jgi:hypothetical protein
MTRSNSDFYDYNKHPDKRIAIKFGTEEKLKSVNPETKWIGPGNYEDAINQILKLKKTSPLFSFTHSQRNIL